MGLGLDERGVQNRQVEDVGRSCRVGGGLLRCVTF